MSEKLPCKTSEHIVAYLDLLGTEDKIKDASYLKLVHDIYVATIKRYNCRANEYHRLGVRFFSDNIVIFIKLAQAIDGCEDADHMDEEEYSNYKKGKFLNDMVWFCSAFQLTCAENGILLRGGITIGEFYHDEIMVWGQALVDAHELEAKKANYPRIILSEVISKDEEILSNSQLYVKSDTDGISFIDYIQTMIFDDDIMTYTEELLAESSFCKAKYQRIIEKYIWHEKYLQNKISELSRGNHSAKNEK